MIKVTKFGTIKFNSVAYLSFNCDPQYDAVNKRLLIYFRAYLTYTVLTNELLLLRKISAGMPTLKYMPIDSGHLEFIPADNNHLYLLRHYD